MSNGIIEGFLTGRADAAWRYARTEENGTSARMWLLAAAAYQEALAEYIKNGDSQAVKDLTAVAMDAGDDALKAGRN